MRSLTRENKFIKKVQQSWILSFTVEIPSDSGHVTELYMMLYV